MFPFTCHFIELDQIEFFIGFVFLCGCHAIVSAEVSVRASGKVTYWGQSLITLLLLSKVNVVDFYWNCPLVWQFWQNFTSSVYVEKNEKLFETRFTVPEIWLLFQKPVILFSDMINIQTAAADRLLERLGSVIPYFAT